MLRGNLSPASSKKQREVRISQNPSGLPGTGMDDAVNNGGGGNWWIVKGTRLWQSRPWTRRSCRCLSLLRRLAFPVPSVNAPGTDIDTWCFPACGSVPVLDLLLNAEGSYDNHPKRSMCDLPLHHRTHIARGEEFAGAPDHLGMLEGGSPVPDWKI
jgi:hypothetical protein